jgi:hypothetical protein
VDDEMLLAMLDVDPDVARAILQRRLRLRVERQRLALSAAAAGVAPLGLSVSDVPWGLTPGVGRRPAPPMWKARTAVGTATDGASPARGESSSVRR